jgi:HK97 family phage major capsid protein
MNRIQRLRERARSISEEMQEMLDAAEAENRARFTPSEDARWKRLNADHDQVTEELRRAVDAEETERRLAATRPREALPATGDGVTADRSIGGRRGPALPTRTEYRALSEGTGSAGGFLVPPEQANEILSYLRQRNAFLAAGPRIEPMTTDEFVFPKVLTSATIAQYAENAAITPSDPTFGSVTLRPKAAAGLVLISRQLWDDSTPVSVRESVMEDLLAVMAVHNESQFLRGDGTGQNLTGLRSQSGVNVTSLGTNGVSIEVDHVLDGVGRLRASRAGAKPVAFVSQRTVNSLLKKKATTNEYLFSLDATSVSIGGVPLVVSDAIPDNLTHGSSSVASEIIIADMAQVIVGENQRPEIAMSEAYAFNALQVAVRIWTRYDVQLANAGAVEVITGVLA